MKKFAICFLLVLLLFVYGHEKNNVILKEEWIEHTVIKTERASHDCTFIGDDLVSFNKPSDGYSYYLNTQTWDTEAKKFINFIEDSGRELEMKSCDYKYDKLLVGNGRAIKYDEKSYKEQGAKLYIYHDAEQWKKSASEEINFTNCGEFDIIDLSQLGVKIYGFWAHKDDCVFVSCNLFNDIYLIQLGKGDEKFKKGTYRQVEENRYNGSYHIIKKWSQDDALGKWAAHGGQYYNGDLYLATNDPERCSIYRCVLKSNGKLAFEELRFDKCYSQNANDLEYDYIDGMCIKDGILYAQPLQKNGDESDNRNIIVGLLN